MVQGFHTHLLVTAALLSLTLTVIQSRAKNEILLITLPDWRENTEYITQCFWDRDNNTFCDWTKTQRTTGEQGPFPEEKIDILESGALGPHGEVCLEFWYSAPSAAIGSELQVLLKSSAGLVEIWSSPTVYEDAWKQVFVPLYITEPQTRVIFQATQVPYRKRQVISNQIGIRRGPCGQQCASDKEIWTDESTRCLCSSGQLSCSISHCPKGHICGPQKRSGTCTVHSDTECSNFDEVLFHFTAPCTYVLAKSCSPTEPLPAFSVEVVNRHKENSSVTTVQQVIVDLKTVARVSLLKSQTNRVVVNGIWKKLPLILKSGAVRIKGNRAAVVLTTRFGLSISFDNAGIVHVRLSASYSNKVCGLCGNFNHFRGDDHLKPDGTYAEDATALAESWQNGEATSSCEVILVPHQCDPGEKAVYASDLFCGRLLSQAGPFSACQSILEAESYFRSCVAGLCSTQGDPAVLCETFQAYADICQMAGVSVPTWRNSTFCTLQCGENSHYDSCAKGCPETCPGQNVARPCGRCEERCECDTGFILSDGKCVSKDTCGCWVKGQHYSKGDVFFKGECEEHCQCMGKNEVQCRTLRCADTEVCKVKDGVRGCFPFKPATCSVYGDPHYITFDGKAYNFQGGCSYILTTTCADDSKVQFTVTGQNLHPLLENFTRSKLENVTLQVDDLLIILSQSGEIYVHNTSVTLPYSTSGAYGSLKVYKTNYCIILEASFGLRMMIDGQNRLFLQVDERHMYELCGLCGTYSGNQGDDFVTPDGQYVAEPFEFGDSWRAEGNNDCVDRSNNPRLCDHNEENEAFKKCFSLFGDGFQPCHKSIHPESHLHSCVYDYCATAGDPRTLCESLKSYAVACMVAGVDLPHWQNGTACANLPTTPPTTTSTTQIPDPNVCPLSCNFDENLCGWEQLIQDSFDWTRYSGSTPSSATGPNQDHTTGTGFYMYIEGDSVTHGDSAHLLSPRCHNSGPLCLKFWYHMSGSATAMALNIYLLQNNTAIKIWSERNNKGPAWLQANIDIRFSGPFQIIVEAIRGSNPQSDVAIDDVSIHFGYCSGSGSGVVSGSELPPTTSEVLPSKQVCDADCSFDRNLCGWNQMVTDAFNWTWWSGSTPTQMTGPSADHSGGGHYLYIEASHVTHRDTARLISSPCSDSGPQCLQFWYHMYGSADTMGLHVYLVQGKMATVIWQKKNDQGNMWHQAQVEFTTTQAFQIIFEGRRGSNEQSDVAIDDVSLHHGHCGEPLKTTPASTSLHPFTSEGPEISPGNSSASAQPLTSASSEQHTSTSMITEIPSTITPTTSHFTTQITTEAPATAETSHTSTPDELTSTNPVAPTTQPQLPSTTTTRVPPTNHSHGTARPQPPTTSEPNPTTAACDVDCSFDRNLCSWNQMLPDAFDWTWWNGSTPTLMTGPSADHSGGGHYLYIEASHVTHGDTAHLISSECRNSGPQCLQFWYHMYGSADTMGLRVYLLQDNKANAIWWKMNDQGNMWHLAQVYFMTTGAFQIIFEGRRGSNDQSDVAIDDVLLHHGNCGEPVKTTTASTSLHPFTTEGPEITPGNSSTSAQPVTSTRATSTTIITATLTTKIPTTSYFTTQTMTEGSSTAETSQTSTPDETTTTNPVAPTTQPELPTTRSVPPRDHPQTSSRLQPPTTSHLTIQPATEVPTTETSQTSSPDELTTTKPVAPTTRPQLPSTTRPMPPTDHSQTTIRPQPPTTNKSNPTTAVPSCRENSHYTTCIPSCAPTCKFLHGQPGCNNSDTCVKGCTCNDGFVLKLRRCVPVQQCGCRDENGNIYQFSEVWYTEHCTQKCICKKRLSRGMIDCDDQKGCPNNAVCFPTSDGHYACSKTGFSKCITKKSEYNTFDKKKYDFEGDHTYLLVQTNNLPNNLPHVYIEVNNTYMFGGDSSSEENQSHSKEDEDDEDKEDDDEDDEDKEDDDNDNNEQEESQRLRALKIKVYNHTVEFRPNRQLVVDGKSTDPPVSPTTGLKIWRHRSRIYLKTDFGLKVKFNGRNSAVIKLPDTYQMKVEGLCGNFDTLSKNDMMKPDGTMATTPQEFGESWRVTK
ncbi:zonadhesin-like [Thalassophryne amazonica]|uniref:zonadhesin-like n=1 Tax=Thalassophryne amazonica TaxID=390379 RepID=UPI001471F8CE|nr:zonadhesin-like [Thalassophryne amazonica]